MPLSCSPVKGNLCRTWTLLCVVSHVQVNVQDKIMHSSEHCTRRKNILREQQKCNTAEIIIKLLWVISINYIQLSPHQARKCARIWQSPVDPGTTPPPEACEKAERDTGLAHFKSFHHRIALELISLWLISFYDLVCVCENKKERKKELRASVKSLNPKETVHLAPLKQELGNNLSSLFISLLWEFYHVSLRWTRLQAHHNANRWASKQADRQTVSETKFLVSADSPLRIRPCVNKWWSRDTDKLGWTEIMCSFWFLVLDIEIRVRKRDQEKRARVSRG